MNERMMNDEEKTDNRKAHKLAELPGNGSNEVNEYGEPVELTVLFTLETGEGRRALSWIWYTATSSEEVGEDGKLHSGMCVAIAISHSH
jgi:hypothetical protein